MMTTIMSTSIRITIASNTTTEPRIRIQESHMINDDEDTHDMVKLLAPGVDRIAVAIMDGRDVTGFWLDAKPRRYRALRNWHIGELVCLDGYWLDANGFSGVIDAGATRHCKILNGGAMDPIVQVPAWLLSDLIAGIEIRARACGLERRWIPTHEGPVFAGDGDPVLAPANADEGELAVAAQPRVLVALVTKVRELLAFVDGQVPNLICDCEALGGEWAADARRELDEDLARLRRIEIP